MTTTDWTQAEINALMNERDIMQAQRDSLQRQVWEQGDRLKEAAAREQAAKARGEVSGLSGRWCLVSERDEALARAEKAEAREREIGEELDKATGMVEMHVADAAAARLLWRQSEAACAKMHAERDAAQQMVTEMRAILLDRARKLGGAQ